MDYLDNKTKYLKTGNPSALQSLSTSAQIMALLTVKLCAYDNYSSLTLQAPNFCTRCVSVECLVNEEYTRTHKPKFLANLWSALHISAEFPASTSTDNLLTIAMKLDPVRCIFFFHTIAWVLYLNNVYGNWQYAESHSVTLKAL